MSKQSPLLKPHNQTGDRCWGEKVVLMPALTPLAKPQTIGFLDAIAPLATNRKINPIIEEQRR
ncbi:MAG: hypothetical protein AAGA60_21150 [Cyanobacteria bacterium P01_E01_bin.42]